MTGVNEYRALKRSEISAIENKVDAFFAAQSVPGRSLAEARWKVLTAIEDSLRLALAFKAEAWIDPNGLDDRLQFIMAMDRYKYSLKHSLDLIDRANLPKIKVDYIKFGSSGSDYLTVNQLLHGDAALYADAVGTFTSIWSSTQIAFGKSGRDVILVSHKERDIQYHAIDLLTAKHIDDYTPLPMLAAIFIAARGHTDDSVDRFEWGTALKAIVASAKVRSGKLTYQFVAARGRELYGDLLHTDKILPLSWSFPWGSTDYATRFSAALISLCFYHIVAIYFGARKHNMLGVGLNDVGLVLRKKEFVHRISMVCGLSEKEVDVIISALTYGVGVKSPDPALQPFVPLDGDTLFLPCMLVITNQWARNMLSLHARVDAAGFNAQSNVFENNMISRISEKCRHYKFSTNKTFNAQGWSEEVDLLLIDESTRTMLVCELRWSIPPGDPREVVHRLNATSEKVVQAKRKAVGVAKHAAAVAVQAGLKTTAGDWDVLGLVVIEGHSGRTSEEPSLIPVVQSTVLMKLLDEGIPVDVMHKVLTTPLWLPRPGIDIEIQHRSNKLGEVEIHGMGFSLIRDSYIEESLLKYVEDARQYSDQELRSLHW